MTPDPNPQCYKNHRFPPESISHALWLYCRFTLSYRDIEERLFARGLRVTDEAIRKWGRKFGQDDANPATSTSATHRRQMTSRRGLFDHQRQAA